MVDPALAKKLRLERSRRTLVLSAPDSFGGAFGEIATSGRGPFDVVLAFVASSKALARVAPRVIAALAEGGALWMAYPKKSSGVVTDLSRDVGWAPLFDRDFQPVAAIALDAVWSATRFKHDPALGRARRERVALRAASPRVVTPPAELARGLSKSPAARAGWAALAYTHKREYARWIEDAKKPETRDARVEKALVMLAAGKTR